MTQNGHVGAVTSVAISPDRQLLASGGEDESIKLWSVRDGRVLRTLNGHAGPVRFVAFASDGRLLISAGGRDNRLNAWNIGDGKLLWRHECGIAAVRPDGKAVACAGFNFKRVDEWDSTITILSTPDGGIIRRLAFDKEDYQITALAFSPDGNLLASSARARHGGEPYLLKIWNARDDSPVTIDPAATLRLDKREGMFVTAESDEAPSLAFSPDGKTLAFSGDDLTFSRPSDEPSEATPASFWDVSTGRLIRLLEQVRGHIALGPDGRTLLSGECGVKLRDASTGALIRPIEPESSAGRPASDREPGCGAEPPFAISADGSLVVVGGAGLNLYGTRGGRRGTFEGKALPVAGLAFSPDGKIFYTEHTGTTAWDALNGWPVTDPRLPNALAYSRDGSRVAVPGLGAWTIRVLDARTGEVISVLDEKPGDTSQVVFLDAGRLLISRADDSGVTTRIRDVLSGGIISESREPPGEVLVNRLRDFVVNGDGNVSWDGAEVRDLVSGKLRREFHDTSLMLLSAAAISADGRKVARAGSQSGAAGAYGNREDSGWIEAYNVESGAPFELTWGQSLPEPSFLTFNHNGTLLAAGYEYGKITVWDVRTGRQTLEIQSHSGTVNSIAFHPNGRMFASSGGDAAVNLWSVGGKLLASLNHFGGDEWAAASPDGLFDGSPRGWSQLIWRFSQDDLETAPLEIFFNEFYYPGLLAGAFAGTPPRAPSDITQKDRRQPVLNLTLAGGRPDGTLTERHVTVRVDVAQAPAGAQDVRLFRNGTLVKRWHGDVLKGQGSASLSASVPVVAGENRFTAYAFNRDNIKSEDRELSLMGAAALARKGTLYILAVGVNRYANSEFDLKYAVPDAAEFGAELKRQQETLKDYERTEVVPLYDRDAKKGNILQALSALARKVQPEDAAVIFFAGHGTAWRNRFYIIPHDLGYSGPRRYLNARRLSQILLHSISDEELEEALEAVSAGQLLMVIDACRSGQAVRDEEARRGPLNSKGLAQLAYEKGMYILAAAQRDQAARGSDQLRHGYLTYALLEGLRGAAADRGPRDGQVTVREWLTYATRRVPDILGTPEEKRSLVQEQGSGRQERATAPGGLQRPRVFYRREQEARPLIVAKPPPR